jgi:hypothetical protein
MQQAIELERFSDHGLEVVSVLVEIELDELASKRAHALSDIRRREEFTKAEADLEDWQKKRQLDHQRDAVSFYQPLIEQGQWALLAMILSQDVSSAKQILDYLDAQRRETLAIQMDAFTKIIEAGALEGWQMEEPAKAVLESLVDQTLRPRVGLGLPEAAPLRRVGSEDTDGEGLGEEEDDEGASADDSSPSGASETHPDDGTTECPPPGDDEDEDDEESIASDSFEQVAKE